MKQLMIEAFELKRKGYYKQAIELFYKMLAKENDNIEILSELGNLYFLLKNYNRALHYTNKALEINDTHINSLITARNVYIAQKDFENASKTANKIYVLTESQEDLYEFVKLLNIRNKFNEATGFSDFIQSPDVAVEIAFSYYQLKKYEEAIKILENIEPEPGYTKHLDLLCKIYFEIKQTDKAKEVLNKLENKDLKDIEILNYMGLAKLDEMKLDEAVEYFRQAVELDAKNPEYNFNLGQAYFLKGWLEEAKKYFVKAICLDSTNLNYQYSLGYALYREGDYKNALTHLNGDLLESKVLKMLIKYQTGDLATAKSELEKLLKENPDNETIVYALAQIYSGLEMNKQALEMIKKAAEINPKSFDYKSFMCNLMIKLGELEEVKPIIDELINVYPNYYYSKVLLAEYQYNVKDFDGLFDTAQELIEMDLNHYEGYYYNALALIEKNDINFAIESLKKAITLDVNNAGLYVKMAEIYQALGQYENAFAYIKEASDIDTSAKNRELYMQLAGILRRKGIKEEEG